MKRSRIYRSHRPTLLFPAGLTFGVELWNIYEKCFGHTDESSFKNYFYILGFHRELPGSLPMQDFTGFIIIKAHGKVLQR